MTQRHIDVHETGPQRLYFYMYECVQASEPEKHNRNAIQ